MRSQQGFSVQVVQRVRYSVQFNLRREPGSDVGSIVGSITHSCDRVRFSLGYTRIPLLHWDSRRQRVLPSYGMSTEINREIDRLVGEIHLFFTTSGKNTFSDTGITSRERYLVT